MLDIAGGILIAIAATVGGLVVIYYVLKTVRSLGDEFDDMAQSMRKSALLARAQAGDTSAYFELGEMLSFMEYDERISFYRKAAEAGHAGGQFRLAEQLRARPRADANEVGVWFASAALQGHREAQVQLAELHVRGTGIARDLVLAHAWFTLASLSDDTYAAMRRDQIGATLTAVELARSASFVASKSGKTAENKRAA